MWDIQAGMGEVLIAPLYEHLRDAGVTFRFFRKVRRHRAKPRRRLGRHIRLDRQADA